MKSNEVRHAVAASLLFCAAYNHKHLHAQWINWITKAYRLNLL